MICGTPSIVWTIAGVVLNVIGVILLFLFGMPFRVRRNGMQYIGWGVDPKEKRAEKRFNALGWLGLGTIVVAAALQIFGIINVPCDVWFMNAVLAFWMAALMAALLISKTPEFWTATFTAGLFFIAAVALIVAAWQLRTVKTERTVALIKEISSEEMESILGFFDFAADKNVSRRAFSTLFARLIHARPEAIRDKRVGDVTKAAAIADAAILAEIDEGIDHPARTSSDESRERELRGRIIQATNFFERVWTLVARNAVDARMFLASQSYNVVAVYYILEQILNDLVKHEGFDFEEFRKLAVRGQGFLDWLPSNDPLRTATFSELPKGEPSLRDKGG